MIELLFHFGEKKVRNLEKLMIEVLTLQLL